MYFWRLYYTFYGSHNRVPVHSVNTSSTYAWIYVCLHRNTDSGYGTIDEARHLPVTVRSGVKGSAMSSIPILKVTSTALHCT